MAEPRCPTPPAPPSASRASSAMSAACTSRRRPKTEAAAVLPFEASRRLTGANLFFPSSGALLETSGIQPDTALLAAWRERVARARALLGWEESDGASGARPAVVARLHASGASLALAAPVDALYTATEVNEWALCAALIEQDRARWRDIEEALAAEALEDAGDAEGFIPPVLEEQAALARFERLAAREARPQLRALLTAAATRGLPHALDDETLTLGAGAGGGDFSLATLPAVAEVPWEALHGTPI